MGHFSHQVGGYSTVLAHKMKKRVPRRSPVLSDDNFNFEIKKGGAHAH